MKATATKLDKFGSLPRYATIDDWSRLTAMSRTAIGEKIATGDLKAIKLGKRTLIDVEAGLSWMASLPARATRRQGA